MGEIWVLKQYKDICCSAVKTPQPKNASTHLESGFAHILPFLGGRGVQLTEYRRQKPRISQQAVIPDLDQVHVATERKTTRIPNKQRT